MAFTSQQLRAINEYGTNILVSAGAGSGKTAVLSERVFNHVANRGINIDELLVLTFTNAAAREMKRRIRDKLSKGLKGEQLKRQLTKLDSSFITTFDAYALSLVKKYHYLLNIDPNVNLIDDNVLKIKISEFLDEMMEEEYEKKDPSFIKLISDFTVKNDNEIRDYILKINSGLNLIYERTDYVSSYEEEHFSDAKIDEYFRIFESSIMSRIENLNTMIDELSYDIDIDKVFPGISSLLHASSYEEIRNFFEGGYKTGRLPGGLEQRVKDLKTEAASLINEIGKDVSISKEQLINEYLNTKENVMILLKLSKKLEERIQTYKKANNLFEFSDIFKMAIEIVDKHEEIAREIGDSFKEILIDEYQDTNDLQDIFISRIARDNVYMVGDIKQSIYRFRNANPNLFLKKYLEYKKGNGGELIELPHNFRSRNEVLTGINDVFERMMDVKIGGADYRDGHQMICGQSQYDENAKTVHNNSLEILNYSKDSDDDLFKKFNKNEIEAFIIGQDIRSKVDNHYQIACFDENGKMALRDARYSDFTILMDRGNEYDLYKQIMTYLEIPLSIERKEKMSDSDLLDVITSIFELLKFISENDYSNRFKLAYMSLCRSFLVEMADDVLFDEISNGEYINSPVFKKIKGIADACEYMSISEILDKIVESFDVNDKINKIGEVRANLVKLDYLYQLSHNLNAQGMDYKAFSEYLSAVSAGGDENEIKFDLKKDNKDAVIVTNIHQSKGLEYPVVYLPYLSSKFNRMDLNTKCIFDKRLGIIIPSMIKDRGLKNTFMKDAYQYEYDLAETGEKIRLFYVALTRAKEKIVMVASLSDESKDGEMVNDAYRLGIRCFEDMLNPLFDDLNGKSYIRNIDTSDYHFSKDYMVNRRNIFAGIKEERREITYKKLEEFLPVEIKQSGFSKGSAFVDEDTIRIMDFGTRMHYYLETLDFSNPEYEYIDKDFVSRIDKFLNSDIMLHKEKAIAHKEYEFIYEEDGNSRHGFIDLLMEYDDHFDIIDYKLKNIDDEHYDEQLNGYRRYIKSISSKKVNCYLYSIIDGVYREVKE